MRKLTLLLILIVSLFAVSNALGKSPYMPEDELKAEARRGFEEILDLWREGKYADLYERTSRGKKTKESFTKSVSASIHRPACCWEKMQDVAVTSSDEHKATVQAKVGLEGLDGSTEYVTKRFKMVKEDGLWKISVSDVLSLAENGKKKSRRHYGGKKQNITIYPSP